MKFTLALAAVLLTVTNSEVQAVTINKLDEETKASVKRAAAAALKVAVAAKKAEAAESIRSDMKEVKKAEKEEASDAIQEAVDRQSKDEEKKAVERAVAHVERIRQQKLIVHQAALKDIEQIKSASQKEHDKINAETKKKTDDAIKKATQGILNLDSAANSLAQQKKWTWIGKGEEVQFI